jgi:hypothetical protein
MTCQFKGAVVFLLAAVIIFVVLIKLKVTESYYQQTAPVMLDVRARCK